MNERLKYPQPTYTRNIITRQIEFCFVFWRNICIFYTEKVTVIRKENIGNPYFEKMKRFFVVYCTRIQSHIDTLGSNGGKKRETLCENFKQ